MTEKNNVLSINEIKKKSELLKNQTNYSLYLKTLSHSQLEAEINFLLKNISTKSSAEDAYDKGKLIIREISHRVDPLNKIKIQKLSSKT